MSEIFKLVWAVVVGEYGLSLGWKTGEEEGTLFEVEEEGTLFWMENGKILGIFGMETWGKNYEEVRKKTITRDNGESG